MFLLNLLFLSVCTCIIVCPPSFCMQSDQQIDMATAITRRLPEQMRLLIKTGISVNAPVAPRLTPLNAVLDLQQSNLQANFHGNYPLRIKEMLSVLILHGALIDPNNEQHKKAYSCITGTPEKLLLAAAFANSIPHLCYALEKGACNQVDVLCYTAYRGKKEIAKLLLDYKTPVNQHNAKLRTPLYYAVTANHPSLVILLLEHGAHTASCSEINCKAAVCLPSLLRKAADRRSIEIMRTLIKQNPDTSLTREAAVHESYELLKLLGHYKVSKQANDQFEKELTYEAHIRGLCPIAKELYRLLIQHGRVLLDDKAGDSPINAIAIRVLFSDKLLQAAFLNDKPVWYVYCLLCHIIKNEQEQVLKLINNVSIYLPATIYAWEELVQLLKIRLDALVYRDDSDNPLVNTLTCLFELIKAKHRGSSVSQDRLNACLAELSIQMERLTLEHKQILLGNMYMNARKIVKNALFTAARQGHTALLDMIATLVDSKTLLKALTIATVSGLACLETALVQEL